MKIGKFDLNTDGIHIISELSANHGGKIEIVKETIKTAHGIKKIKKIISNRKHR